MALITGITGQVSPGSAIIIEGEDLDTVTDVLLHSPSGETIEPQIITSQEPGIINATVVIGDLPYGELALDMVTPGGSVTEPVTMEAIDGIEVVTIGEVSEGDVLTDPAPDMSLESGDQVVVVGGTGTVSPDGTVEGTVQVAVWDATTETYTELMWITDTPSGVEMGSPSMLIRGANNLNVRGPRDISFDIGE